MAESLGLTDTPLPWHARRGGLARLADALRQLLTALAHMAGDLAHLASTEVGEIAEPHQPGRGGSSAMPHKRNPVSCTVILAASHQARGALLDAFDEAPIGGHERPAGAWHGEWHVLPALLGLASGALREARVLAQGMEIDVTRMRANLDATRGLLFADAASALLARDMGTAEAKAAVTRAADRVRAEQIDLINALRRRDGAADKRCPRPRLLPRAGHRGSSRAYPVAGRAGGAGTGAPPPPPPDRTGSAEPLLSPHGPPAPFPPRARKPQGRARIGPFAAAARSLIHDGRCFHALTEARKVSHVHRSQIRRQRLRR